nr:hypothetical protein [uncultured Cohaesibacter sp.]
MTALVGQELLLIVLAVIIGALLGCALRAFLASKQGKELANRAEALYDPEAAAAHRAEDARQAALAEAESEDLALAPSVAAALTAAPLPGGQQQPKPDAQDEGNEVSGKVAMVPEAAAKPAAAPSPEVDTSVDPTKVAEGMAGEGLLDAPSVPQAEPEALEEKEPEAAVDVAKTDPSLDATSAAALAALPADASAEEKAEAVGTKPKALDAPRGGAADDLKKIKGIGKVIEGKLNNLGIYHFDQIANWTRDEVNWVTTFLDFKGRIDRENWIPQAKGLMSPENAMPAPQTETAPAALSASDEEDEELDLEAEEKKMAEVLAALPKGASAEQKAEAVGTKPKLLAEPRDGAPDDLKRIKGVGKVIEGKLNDLGIYHFDQIGNWTRKEVNYVSTFLSFKGRIDRENWIAQAKLLAAGQETEFSMRVSKGEVESSKS